MAYSFAGEREDLEAMLADSCHSITVGDVSRRCFYEMRSELGQEIGGAAGQVLQIETATIMADHFPDIAEGDEATVWDDDGWVQEYAILRIMPSGPMMVLLLQRIS